MATRVASIDPTTGFGTSPTAVPKRVAPAATVASAAGAPASATTQRVPPTAQPTEPSAIASGAANRQISVGGINLNLDIPDGATAQPPATATPAATSPDATLPDTTDYYNTGVNGGASYDVHPVPMTSTPTPGTPPPIPTNRLDDAAIGQWVAYYATLPGADPSLRTDPAYWIGVIKEKGGLGAENTGYWEWMALNNYKQQAPAASAGTGANALGNYGYTPNSQLDSVLAQFFSGGGLSEYGQTMQQLLQGLIASGGLDSPQTQQRLLGAREDAANAFTGQLADVRNALASQGQLGSGFGDDAVARLGERIAPTYAGAVRDIQTNAMDTANENIMSAFAMATGLAQSEASNLLQALGTGVDRDIAFAQIALQQLSENRQWNQFLAQYGLDRETLAYQIQHGDTAQLIELLGLWMEGAGTSANGQAAPANT